MRVSDPGTFVRQLVATDPNFEMYEISNQLRNTIVARFVDVIGQAKIPVLDMAGNYDKMSRLCLEKIGPDLQTMGMTLTLFYIENISLPPEVEQALDKRTQMGVLGDLGQYTKFQTAEAIRDAAKNPGGVAGVGVGLGAGLSMGQQMTGAMGVSNPAAPPPLPQAISFFMAYNGAQAGPFDLATLSSKVHDGSLTRSTLVWKQGMPNWVAAETVPELQQLFASLPPPLPKS
jgi:membrane protease subunit (stomatin/prohibitin family)